jgi:hypothetical protein
VDSTYYVKTKDINEIETKKIHINSPAKYMLYCLNLVNSYTTLDIDFNNSLEEFNCLNGNSCIDIIFKHISDREKKEFRNILEMVENDVIQNEYETYAFISNQVERFGKLANITISPLLNILTEKIESLDEKKIEKIFSKITK